MAKFKFIIAKTKGGTAYLLYVQDVIREYVFTVLIFTLSIKIKSHRKLFDAINEVQYSYFNFRK